MNEDSAAFLLTGPGRDLLAAFEEEAASGKDRALIRLRKIADPGHVSAASEVAEARRRASAKFGDLAARMYFTTEALEQASSAGAAAYHARRFVDAGIETVIDLCGGIGADALAFARAGLRVTVYEIDPVRALFAAENVRVAGFQDRVVVRCEDACFQPWESMVEGDKAKQIGVWFDPARRADNRRIADPEEYLPPLSLVTSLRDAGIDTIGVKLAPAVDHSLAGQYAADLEFLSDRGECKEALLWMGRLHRNAGVYATLLTDSPSLSSISLLPSEERASGPQGGGQGEGVSYLYEPDPAVIRGHLVQALGERLGARPIDPHIAYLIGPSLVPTPFAKAYEMVDRFPFHLKKLQQALRARSVGRVVIKKRGFPQEPEQVRKQLKLIGDREITVVLTRVGLQHQAILCLPIKNS